MRIHYLLLAQINNKISKYLFIFKHDSTRRKRRRLWSSNITDIFQRMRPSFFFLLKVTISFLLLSCYPFQNGMHSQRVYFQYNPDVGDVTQNKPLEMPRIFILLYRHVCSTINPVSTSGLASQRSGLFYQPEHFVRGSDTLRKTTNLKAQRKMKIHQAKRLLYVIFNSIKQPLGDQRKCFLGIFVL